VYNELGDVRVLSDLSKDGDVLPGRAWLVSEFFDVKVQP
jgi:hypothetical protein